MPAIYRAGNTSSFTTAISKVEETADKKWVVTLENGEQHQFDYLFTASITTPVPRW